MTCMWVTQAAGVYGDLVPFRFKLLKASQQETEHAPGFLDLNIHRVADGLALDVDR